VFALIIGFCAYFIGSLSKLFSGEGGILGAGESLIKGDLVVPTMLAAVVPTGLIGIVAVLILSASMSTLSSVSLASASVVAVDIYKGAVNKKASDKRTNTVMRVLCLAFILISVILAVANEKLGITAIAYMMGLSWGTLAGCFMGPFVLGVLWRGTTRSSVLVSIIGSLSLTAALILFFGYHQNGFACTFGEALKSGVGSSPMIGVICMVYSVISTYLVSLFTRRPTKKMIHNAFDKAIENEIK
jgi:Na+/proline symporter